MKGLPVALIAVILSLNCRVAEAQSYKILSFEGKQVVLTLNDSLPGRVLEISCPTDHIFLRDCIGVQKVEIMKEKFLKIIYDVRGGTGLNLQNTLVVCLNEGKINVAMLISSYANSFVPDKKDLQTVDLQNTYGVEIKLDSSDESSNHIVSQVHEESEKNGEPENKYNHDTKIILFFDDALHVFYSGRTTLCGNLFIEDTKNQSKRKIRVDAEVPMIKLGSSSYYYIHNQWYERASENVLLKTYYR